MIWLECTLECCYMHLYLFPVDLHVVLCYVRKLVPYGWSETCYRMCAVVGMSSATITIIALGTGNSIQSFICRPSARVD